MLRYCASTANPIKVYKRADGQWSVDGIGAEFYLEGMLTAEAAFKPLNTTFYFTTSTDDCLKRLSNNDSDISTVFLPIETLSPYYYVAHPLIAGRLNFVTGYNMTDGYQEAKNSATVASNFYLLSPGVDLWASMLLLSFITFITVRISILYSHFRRLTWSTLYRRVKKEVIKMVHYSSSHFKLITILYSILCFFLITSFLCLYKTSHVIVVKPFYPKSYLDSLDYESSLAFQYDQFAAVSTIFKNSPKDSLRGKLWAKLVAAGKENAYAAVASDPAMMPILLKDAADQINVHKGIGIAAPLISPLLKSAYCGFSPEDQLWIVKLLSDACEPEVIYGHAIKKVSPFTDLIASKLQVLFETRVVARNFERGLDQSASIAELVGTSKSHQWRQKVVCDDENAFAPDPQVHAIPLSYFSSFFFACLIVWLFAFIMNVIRIIFTGTEAQRPARR